MTLEEIKNAVDNGNVVHWCSAGYNVQKNGNNYDICCAANGHRIGLTWLDGVTLNGKQDDFYVAAG